MGLNKDDFVGLNISCFKVDQVEGKRRPVQTLRISVKVGEEWVKLAECPLWGSDPDGQAFTTSDGDSFLKGKTTAPWVKKASA